MAANQFSFKQFFEKKISLKLMINKKTNRVVFVESDKDFVDVLLSFLTLPMGTIIRLLGKQSTVGCMDKLYQSVENFDAQYLETDACKTMLLYPRNAAEDLCERLALNLDDQGQRSYYTCSWNCIKYNSKRSLSSVKNVCQCPTCHKQMDQPVFPRMSDEIGEGERGFVEESVRYMISDDLNVMPVSVTNTLPLLKKLGINDEAYLVAKSVNVGATKVLYLLKRALLSVTPLTDAFLSERDNAGALPLEPIDINQSHTATTSSSNSKTMNVKLFVSKSNNKVLFAEAQENFMDLLFRFLTFPLGLIIKRFGGNSGLGCVDQLYKSAVDLSARELKKSRNRQHMLLSPVLAPHYGCKNQLLDAEEARQGYFIPMCEFCFSSRKGCSHGNRNLRLSSLDLRGSGGGFVKGPNMFMVTDELDVKMLSPIAFLSGLNAAITDIDEQVVSLGETEALALLKASLISKTALSHAFVKRLKSPPEKKPEQTFVKRLKSPPEKKPEQTSSVEDPKCQILAMDPLPDISKCYSLVLQEKQRGLCTSPTITPDAAALHAYATSTTRLGKNENATNSSQGRSRPTCEHCGHLGHAKARCYKLHGYPPGHPKHKSQGRAQPSTPLTSSAIHATLEDTAATSSPSTPS